MNNPAAHSHLPSRYDEVLNKRFAEVVRQLKEPAVVERRPSGSKHLLPTILGSAGLLAAFLALRPVAARTRSSVAFGPANSVQVMGLSQSPEEFIPPAAASPSPAPAAPAERPAPPAPPRRATTTRPSALGADLRGIVESKDIASIAEGDAGTTAFLRVAPTPAPSDGAVLFDEDRDAGVTVAAAREDDRRRVVNLGTRVKATLVYAVRTGSAPVPVTARIEEDVRVGESVVIRAGSLLVGQALATRSDDRVQVALSALVQDGFTSRFQGVALGPDGELGVAGRLVRKASGSRRWTGRAAGALGTALSLGLARRASGVAGTAAREIAADVDHDLDVFERRWGQELSDKVIEAGAGTPLVVSLVADLEVR